MRTKLVYVLTSTPDATYIEQALMSVYTARYHNPDAHIVLMVDDLTDKLLVGKRAEILDYISEKVIVEYAADISMFSRSRLLKTSIRERLRGSLLFIDCDTIITGSLEEVDTWTYSAAAVWESHLPIAQFHPDMIHSLQERAGLIGVDITQEEQYFSSGVIFTQDDDTAAQLYKHWQKAWQDCEAAGVRADQPALLKADVLMGHVLQPIDSRWNSVMFTQIPELQQGLILHFSQAYLASYLFGKRFCGLLRENGLRGNAFYEWAVLHPHCTYIPFDNYFYFYKIKDLPIVVRQLSQMARDYANHIDPTFADVQRLPGGMYPQVYNLLGKGHYHLAAWLLCFLKWRKTHWKKFVPKNYCSKN